MELTLYVDGSCWPNPGPASVGAVGVDALTGSEVFRFGKRVPDGTNSETEYQALIEGLAAARDYGYDRVVCHTDSRMLANHVSAAWPCRRRHLKELLVQVRELQRWIELTITWIPREQNAVADQLAASVFGRVRRTSAMAVADSAVP